MSIGTTRVEPSTRRGRVTSSPSRTRPSPGLPSGRTEDAPGAGGILRSGPTVGWATGFLLAAFGFVIGSRAISDNSFFTHLANGRLFWEGAGIPRVDPYSFTAGGEPVTVQSWLASLIYAGLLEFTGEWSLRLFNGLLCLALTAGLWALTRPAHRLVARVALTGAAMILGTLLWSPRPLLFGLVGLVAVLLVVDRRLPLWSLIPVLWLWVNTHGSFPIVVVLLLAILFGQLLDEVHGRHSTVRDAWMAVVSGHEVRVLGVAVAGIALGGLNPLGPRLLWFPVHLLGRREALDNVIEWAAPTFTSPAELGFLALVGALLVAAKAGAGWSRLAPGFVVVVAGLLAVRNVALASVVLVWAAAPALSHLRLGTLDGDSVGLLARVVAAISGAVLLVASVAAVGQGPLDLREYPESEVSWLEERSLVATDGVRLLTRETDGNYLEMRYGADANVFVDDRFDFYPQDVLDDLDTLIFGGDYRDVLVRRRIDVVLWEDRGSFARWISESDDWFVAHRTPSDTASASVTKGDSDEMTWIVACRLDSAVVEACRR